MGSVTAMLLSHRMSSWKLPVSDLALQDGISQEVVALLRAVAPEAFGRRHLVGGTMNSLDDSWAQGLGDVANAEADDVGLGVLCLEDVHLFGNVREQVVVRQLEVVVVDESHGDIYYLTIYNL